MRDNVVVDTSNGVAYVGVQAGGIEAVDISSGRSIWSSSDAALPLAVNGSLVLARGEEKPARPRLPLVVYDTSGRVVRTLFAPLPDDVRAFVEDSPTTQFRVAAMPDGNGFIVTWSFVSRRVPAVLTIPERTPQPKQYDGAFRIEPASGAIVAVPAPAQSKPEPWRAGNVIAVAEGGRGGPLVLRRTDAASGRELSANVIARLAIADLRSADGAFLMVSERVGAGGPDDPEYRWSVWSLESGDKALEVRRDVSASPFFVDRETLVYVAQPHGYRSGATWVDEPLKIDAVRLSNGVPQWERAVRDVAYRGPVPAGH